MGQTISFLNALSFARISTLTLEGLIFKFVEDDASRMNFSFAFQCTFISNATSVAFSRNRFNIHCKGVYEAIGVFISPHNVLSFTTLFLIYNLNRRRLVCNVSIGVLNPIVRNIDFRIIKIRVRRRNIVQIYSPLSCFSFDKLSFLETPELPHE